MNRIVYNLHIVYDIHFYTIHIRTYRHTLPSVVTRRASSFTTTNTATATTTTHRSTFSSNPPLFNTSQIGTEPKNMPFISSLQLGSYVEVCVSGRASVRDNKVPSWCLGKG